MDTYTATNKKFGQILNGTTDQKAVLFLVLGQTHEVEASSG